MNNDIASRSIKNLAVKSFKNNKVRNVLLVIAIILTTLLYTSLFTISSSIVKLIKSESDQRFFYMNNLDLIFYIIIAAVAVLMTGYLIIYNIFNISLVKDIQFYGLLITIGATVKQIRSMLYKQVVILCALGISPGILGGCLLGKAILKILGRCVSNAQSMSFSADPLIFISAVLFSLITVFISIIGPTVKISSISPIECVRYSAWKGSSLKKTRKTINGGRIYRLAWSNLCRQGNKTLLIILSISLSLVLLNSTISLSNGFDTSLYLKSMMNTDFVIGNKCYFDWNSYYWKEEGALSDRFCNAVKQSDFFKEGGGVYYNVYTYNCTLKADMIPQKSGTWGFDFQRDLNGNCYSELYGLDDFPLSKLEIIEGSLDMDKLKSGKYIIAGVECEKYAGGNPSKDADYFKIGDKIKVILNGTEHEYEVLAKCCIRKNNTVRYESHTFGLKMYLPSVQYKELINNPVLVNYSFDVQDNKINEAEEFIKYYTNNVETNMGYESKQTYTKYLKGLESLLNIGGETASLIIGIIGIINFINSMIASIISRKTEFAMLESIGMTKKQIMRMLSFEGMYYSLISISASLIIGSAVSYFLIRTMEYITWCFKYVFTLQPIIISSVFIILFSIIIPLTVFAVTSRQDLVHRLRENF